MFERHKQEKLQASWESEDRLLRGVLAVAVGGGGPAGGGPAEVPLVLKSDERAVYLFTGGGLFEPRRGPGHYAGASSGFSIPIGSTGVRYRIGQTRGTYVQGEENPTVIDTGTVVITDQRVVLLGSKRSVEWAFSKLLAIQHYQDRPWTAIQVSNRQKVTGVTYDVQHEHNFRLRLEAAIALFHHDTAKLIGELRDAIRAHDAANPTAAMKVPDAPIVLPPPPPPPADWYPDPERRHQFRYWDGSRWTDQVADGGMRHLDAP